ncbi:MAG TPA: endonuclease/exonuclease/phosphatase family protein [Gaiellaceae bacterium]|nr:endonuclease/exonuclease/phosphatase family protein [Gaiellaceae bacterium]
MRLLVRSWNLFHGRTHPQSETLQLERMVRLVTADAPDAVALQEVPMWGVRRLESWSGMQAAWAMTMPALLGPVGRALTDADPRRFRSSLTGQANALLVNPHLETGRHRRLVLNPGLGRLDRLRGGQRRVCHALEIETPSGRLVLANLHASNHPDARVPAAEIARAAGFLADAPRAVLCGDFNVPRHAVPGYSEPVDGIDQILVRGLALERGPERWPEARRRAGDRLLSDHAPVEAVIAWTS